MTAAANPKNVPPRSQHRNIRWPVVAAGALALAVFLFDVRVELGVAAGVPYVVLVCLAYLEPKRRWIWIATGVGIALTLVGCAFSPLGGEMWKVVVNRMLAMLAIGITAAFVDLAKRQQQQLHDREASLKQLVAKRTEELEQSEERMRRTFESSPSGMVVVDGTGRIMMANLQIENIFGFEKEEMQGQSIEMLLPPELRNRHVAYRGKFMQNPQSRSMAAEHELYGRHKTGRLIPVDVGLNPVKFGTETCVLAAVVDITDRKRAQEAMEAANQVLVRSNYELEQFAYVASHDLQEPLRKMYSYAQLTLDECSSGLNDDGREYLRIVIDGATRLKDLVTDLLGFSRINSVAQALVPLSSEQCLRTAIHNLELLVRDSNARLSIDPLPSVIGDATQLTMLFQNIIGNAIKYCEKVPQIHIGGRDLGEFFEFCVSDNGIGIESQYFDRIFGIFKRLHSRQEYSGTGIGLANCKRIVERFGGSIWVESTPGEGSEFYFTIPKVSPEQAAASTMPAPATSPQ